MYVVVCYEAENMWPSGEGGVHGECPRFDTLEDAEAYLARGIRCEAEHRILRTFTV